MISALRILTGALLLLAVAACERQEGPAERAGENIDQAMEQTHENVEQALEEAGKEMEEAGDRIREQTAQ